MRRKKIICPIWQTGDLASECLVWFRSCDVADHVFTVALVKSWSFDFLAGDVCGKILRISEIKVINVREATLLSEIVKPLNAVNISHISIFYLDSSLTVLLLCRAELSSSSCPRVTWRFGCVVWSSSSRSSAAVQRSPWRRGETFLLLPVPLSYRIHTEHNRGSESVALADCILTLSLGS